MRTLERAVSMTPGQITREAAQALRADIPALAAEMVHEIQSQIPEYARPLDENYTKTLRLGVEQALRRYVDVLDRGGQARVRQVQADDGFRQLYRAIGAGEMREGRSLESLHAAIRLCGRVAWRRLGLFADGYGLPLSAVTPLAELIFDNLDYIAKACAEGYAQAQATEVGELDRRRRHLLDLLIAEPPAAAEAVAAAAAAARWQLPRRLAAVAVEAPASPDAAPVLSPEILAGLERAEPCLIVPDPRGAAQVRAVVNGLARYRAAVGPPVAPADAAKSLRWARRALELADRGLIDGTGIIWCSDHLATLAVFQDEDLLSTLIDRRLAPLADLRDGQRELLTDTLLAWLQLNMNANEVAARLHVHPQTVRHRLRQLARLFGEQMRDPDLRFELEIALRAERAARSHR
jgi:hypothetical protein